MVGLELACAVLATLAAVALGTVAHECCHAAVLRAADVPFDLRLWRAGRVFADPAGGSAAASGPRTGEPGGVPPAESAGDYGTCLGALAAVRLRGLPASPGPLRAASLAPLALALPFLLVPAGLVADPFAGDAVVLQAALVGWLACAIPSPADFGIAFHAEDLLEGGTPPEVDPRVR